MQDYSFDLARILWGDISVLFLLEIVLRTTVLYLFALVCLRFLGKRSTRQLTPVDVILIVALGSAVGDPMFYPDVPLLHGMLVIALIILLQRFGIHLANLHKRVEQIVKGEPIRLVKDGMFDLSSKGRSALSRSEISAMLREHGYRHLGQVERMYVETDGSVSHYRFSEHQVRPGLPIDTPWDVERPEIVATIEQLGEQGPIACTFCGQVLESGKIEAVPPCPRCHHNQWVRAA